MATYRQIINRTLIALGHGDDLVGLLDTNLTDNYHIKIAQFINDILEQVEDAAQWRVLVARDTATISANANSATLASSNERSRVWKVHEPAFGRLIPLAYDVTTSSAQNRLHPLDLAEILRRDQDDSNQSRGTTPTHFALDPTATAMGIVVYPRPSANVNVELDMVIPQSRLPHTTLAELDVNVSVPALPVVLGAIWWALEDRGEELGPRGMKADVRYQEELSQAVALEMAQQGADTLVPV